MGSWGNPTVRVLHPAGQRDQLQPHFLRDASRPTATLALPDTSCTLPRNTLAPQADRLHGHAQFLRDRCA
ncbi:hypothetical protein P3T22_005052 [Paraburkholderia sp. GAS348]